MRRSDREITDLGEILSIINDCKVIHLAMVDDGEPYLLPLNFGYACRRCVLVLLPQRTRRP